MHKSSNSGFACLHWDSAEAMAASIAGVGDVHEVFTNNSSYGADWVGADKATVLRYAREGAPELAAQVRNMPGMDIPAPVNGWRRVWSDYDGDTWDQERLLNGQRHLSRRVRGGEGGRRTRQCLLRVHIGGLYRLDWRAMQHRALCAVRVIDDLEQSGVSVRVDAVSAATDWGRKICDSYTVKGFGEAPNLARLCAWLGPWCLRWHIFRVRWLHHGWHSGAGGTCAMPAPGEDLEGLGVLTIQTDECLNMDGAREWLAANGVEAFWKEQKTRAA